MNDADNVRRALRTADRTENALRLCGLGTPVSDRLHV